MPATRLIGSAPNQVSTNAMLGNLAFQNAESVNLGMVSVEQLLGQVPAALGTAAAPTYTFTGDPNTGLYSPGADQVAISTGGTGRLFVDASGRVGIGTNSLSRTFNVAGSAVFDDGTVQTTVWSQFGSGIGGFGTNNNYPVVLATNGSERLRITSDGKVGIGTSAPGSKLEIGGEISPRINLNSSGTGIPGTIFQGAGVTHGSITHNIQTGELSIKSGAPGQGAYFITFGTNDGTERARIDSSGRLLVGTSSSSASAAAVLQGFAGSSTGQGIIQLQVGKNTAATGINEILGSVRFANSDGNIGAWISGEADLQWNSGDYPSRLVFSTTADGASSPTERFRISSDGSMSSVIPGGSTLYPASMCRAWVNFNGTGTVAIRASFNVSSVTDNGVGDHTVNFTTAMIDANYSVQIPGSIANNWSRAGVDDQSRLTAASVRVTIANSNGAAADRDCITVAIFR